MIYRSITISIVTQTPATIRKKYNVPTNNEKGNFFPKKVKSSKSKKVIPKIGNPISVSHSFVSVNLEIKYKYIAIAPSSHNNIA